MTRLRDVSSLTNDEVTAENARRLDEAARAQELAQTSDESVLRRAADELLGQYCPRLTLVEKILTDPPSLRLTFAGGVVVDLSERVLNRPSELATTIMLRVGRAVSIKRGTSLTLLDYLLRAAVEVHVDDEATDLGYIEGIIAAYIGDLTPTASYDLAVGDPYSTTVGPFLHKGALHMHGPSLRKWWNDSTYGRDNLSPQRLANLLRLTTWVHVTLAEPVERYYGKEDVRTTKVQTKVWKQT